MKKTDAPIDETYFAALESEELLPKLLERKLMDIQEREYTGYSELVFKAYNAYYGLDEMGIRHLSSDLLAAGEQGELVKAKLNIFRNLIQHVLVMTTSDRPALEAKAVNSDPDSQEQAILAAGIIEYYLRLLDAEKYLYNAAETALVCGQGYIEIEWDPQEGDIITPDPDSDDIVYDGDIKFYSLMPWDVFQDPEAVGDSSSWIMTRRWVNRYDLIAKSPSNKKKLLSAQCKHEVLQTERSVYHNSTRSTDPRSRDLVPLYSFYHKRTASVPQGRLVQFVDEETAISDTPLPYKNIPVYKISPSDKLDTVRGYANGFDVLSIQKARDGLASIALSNQNSQGVQKIWMPDTATPKYEQLAKGLALIQSPPNAKPEVLQLTSTPAEVFKFMDTLGSEAETQMGVSSVTRGQPDASLRTGSALALVQSMSIQFNSAFQRSWVKLL
ncbi:MAG: hypothetical protein KDA17_08340, partial [Candidatus Saccharibacteria bacterium]|nr:hypothetical protein [Candidatus Saccharibacteria bacterium]